MNPVPDLKTEPWALQVRKKPLPVHVRFASADGVCETLEGPVRYRRGDAILTGSRGEQWPVGRDGFLTGYQPDPPTIAGEDGTYRKRPVTVLARRLDRAMSVPVGWQHDPLQGRPGDWLLRYEDGSHGVVNDAIFRETYEPADQQTRWPPPD
jgi:PGDYG protein